MPGTPLKLLASKPTIYLQVSGLWAGAALVIFSLNPPAPRQTIPTTKKIGRVDSDTNISDPIDLPVAGDKIGCQGLRFAATAKADDVAGTITVGIMRDQDTPTAPPYDRPVSVTITITRKSGDDLYAQTDIAVQTDAPPKDG
jgi:hypothetical protein